MPAERYFFEGELIEGSLMRLEEQEFHHLAHVMRAQIGETVEVVNGSGQLAQAQIKSLEKRQAELSIISVVSEHKSPFEIILAQAIPRLNRLDLILEKGTELGMTQLWLFPGTLSERKKISEQRLKRLRTITITALKQCGRLYLPQITLKPPIGQWDTLSLPSFFGDLNPSAPPLYNVWTPDQGIIFFIGPESGFTDDEVTILDQLGAKGVKLHQNILRTDTASITALSLITHML